MKRFTISALAVFAMLALLAAPALAEPGAVPIPAPYGTATPRDWDALAPSGDLLEAKIKADSAILMDESTGNILFEKEPDKKQYPASITKIMTCLLAVKYIEDGHSKTELVTIGALPKTEPSSMGLKKDETLTLEDLLYGLMLKSGNDSACAVAIYVGGAYDKFIEMMNAEAQALGMTNTHYANPHGLHDDNHYTTAKDMALLTREAMRHPLFRTIVSTPSVTIKKTNKSAERKYDNHNRLVSKSKNDTYGYVYATGVKTGFTSKAGQTLVSTAKSNGVSLIAIALKDIKKSEKEDYKFIDCVTMFEYGFNFYDTLDLKDLLIGRDVPPMPVQNAAGSDPGKGNLELVPAQITGTEYSQFITRRKVDIQKLRDDPAQFEQQVTYTKDTAPIQKDDVVGKVSYLYQGEVVYEFNLQAFRDVKEMPTPAPTPSLSASGAATGGSQASVGPGGSTPAPGGTVRPIGGSGGIGSFFLVLGIILLALLVALLAIRFVNIQRRNRKYRQYNYRQGGGNARMRR